MCKWPVQSPSWSTAVLEAVSTAVTPLPRVVFTPGMAVPLQKESPLQVQELHAPRTEERLVGSASASVCRQLLCTGWHLWQLVLITRLNQHRCVAARLPPPSPIHQVRGQARFKLQSSMATRLLSLLLRYSKVCLGEGEGSTPAPSPAGGVLFEHDP